MRKLFALMMTAALFGSVQASADSVSLNWLSSGTSISSVAPGGSDTLRVVFVHDGIRTADTMSVRMADVSVTAPKITGALNTPPPGMGSVVFTITPAAPLGTQVTGFGGLAGVPVAAGTYTAGTITVVAGAALGSFVINPFQRPAVDDWLDAGYNAVAVSLIGATMNVIPEPGTAALLGLGLVGLIAVGRRSRA